MSLLPESLPTIPSESLPLLPLPQAGPHGSCGLTASCRPRPEGVDTFRCHPLPPGPLLPSAVGRGVSSSSSGPPFLSSPFPHSQGAPLCCLRLEPSHREGGAFLLLSQPGIPYCLSSSGLILTPWMASCDETEVDFLSSMSFGTLGLG